MVLLQYLSDLGMVLCWGNAIVPVSKTCHSVAGDRIDRLIPSRLSKCFRLITLAVCDTGIAPDANSCTGWFAFDILLRALHVSLVQEQHTNPGKPSAHIVIPKLDHPLTQNRTPITIRRGRTACWKRQAAIAAEIAGRAR